jgi:hypothetical protein
MWFTCCLYVYVSPWQRSLNRYLWIVACILWHLNPSQRHTSWTQAMSLCVWMHILSWVKTWFRAYRLDSSNEWWEGFLNWQETKVYVQYGGRTPRSQNSVPLHHNVSCISPFTLRAVAPSCDQIPTGVFSGNSLSTSLSLCLDSKGRKRKNNNGFEWPNVQEHKLYRPKRNSKLNMLLGRGTVLQAERSRFGSRCGHWIFNLPSSSSLTLALGSTRPLTEMSTRNLPGFEWRSVGT